MFYIFIILSYSDIGSYGSKHSLLDVADSLKKTGVAIKGFVKQSKLYRVWNEPLGNAHSFAEGRAGKCGCIMQSPACKRPIDPSK